MCIALPCRIVSVIDVERMLVAVTGDGDAQEIVSAALVLTPDLPLDQLVGSFVLIHAGFALSLIDEAEARSRLQVFAALKGSEAEIDLADFYAETTGAGSAPGLKDENGITADTAAQSIP